MAYLKGRFIFDGIHAEFNCKTAVMEKLMQEEGMQREIAIILAENPMLRKKLRSIEEIQSSKRIVSIEFTEEDLEALFDELVCRDYPNILRLKVRILKEYWKIKEFFEEDKNIVDIDIVHYAAYGMMDNEKCREKLEELLTNKEEYYAYWEASEYKNNWRERDIPAEYVWTYRLLLGMIAKIRKDECCGETYRMFYQILYAGNRYWKKLIKKGICITSAHIKAVTEPIFDTSNDIFSIKCQMILLFLMGDDMGIPVAVDDLMMSFLRCYSDERMKNEEAVEGEIIVGENEEIEEVEIEETKEESKEETAIEDSLEKTGNEEEENDNFREYTDCEVFFQAFDNKHRHHNSVTELLMSGADLEQAWYVFYALDMFRIGARKFKDYALSDDECECLWSACEKWDFRKYGHLMIIAVLCKYIHRLEQVYLDQEKDAWAWKLKWKEIENEKEEDKKRQDDYEIKRAQAEKKQMEDVILKQELQIAKLEKRIDAAKKQLQDSSEELSALRSYVYMLDQEDRKFSEETMPDREKIVEKWRNKKVLVVGGHTNWQNKLREMFPKWQYLTARQSAQIGNVIGGKEIIVCNTAFLDHPSYYKLLSAKDKRQKLCYVHSNNMKKCLKELEGQIR